MPRQCAYHRTLMDPSYWSNGSLKDVLHVWRVQEAVLLVLLGSVLYGVLHSIDFGEELPVPSVVQYSDTAPYFVFVANNPLFSYPIKLDGHWCYPYDLQYCASTASEMDAPTTTCCNKYYDKNTVVNDTVTSDQAGIIVALVSLAFLVGRVLLFRRAYLDAHAVPYKYWIKCFWDSLLGFAFAVLLNAITTDFIKNSVAAPRPNYYALKIFSGIFESDRQSYDGNNALLAVFAHEFICFLDNATLSFPSGHASNSMAAFAFITAVCLIDLKPYHNLHSMYYVFLVCLSFVPVAVSAFYSFNNFSE
jgi:hypothetical protein